MVSVPMSCYSPIKRFVTGSRRKSDGSMVDTARLWPAYQLHDGRKQEVHFLYRRDSGSDWQPWFDEEPPVSFEYVSGLKIPCGKCQGCLIDKSRDWANRLLLEMQYHRSAYFVTLTYDEDHVPRSYYPDPETGEAQPSLTLSKRDFQLFMKRLRKRHVSLIRFFACGEYGPQTFRPHYHAIIFGLELSDLVPYARNEQGDMTYQSNFLTSCWAVRDAPTRHGSATPLSADPGYFCTPLGRVVVAPVTWQSCAYVARYTTKKFYGPQAKYYEMFNIVPPFLLMSRDPGIGKQWFLDHPDVYDFEYINVSTPDGGRKFRPPRYFDRLYDEDHPEEMANIKLDRRRMAEEAMKAKVFDTSLTAGELLEIEEQEFLKRIKPLKRKEL